jgi:hypothetical protein
MKFDDPGVIEQICTQLRQADYTRSRNRAMINNLFNGAPPYSERDELENNIEINVNFLEGTRLSHEARSQFYQSMLKPGNFFKSVTDYGPVHKRQEWGSIVTHERNKIMKRNMVYIESLRSKIAMNILHGIAPCGWRDDERWCPYAMDIADVYVPGNILLTMENMPYFAIYRAMTAPEMIKLTQAGKLDPAWNKPMLKGAISWVDKASMTLMNQNWPDMWTPEKMQERMKGDTGFYYGDNVPTINVFDFYFWNDSNKESGWNRRMILDPWSMPDAAAVDAPAVPTMTKRVGKLYDDYARKFLYNPGERKICQNLSELVTWQFADLSAVAPFRYHSVRSLGFLLFAVCHLQNRLRCKVNEAVFEQLMIYFRVSSQEDVQRALKLDMVSRGFVDESIKFMQPSERYQVDHQLAMMGINLNQDLIHQNSSSYTAQPQNRDSKERTKFEVMADVNAMTTLVSAALAQAYMYQMPEYREIARRFAIKDSRDPEVRQFQANCLRRGVSEKVLYNTECWEHDAERTMGAGNKTLEMAISEQLMQYRPMFDPEPQRQILKNVTLAITDDPALANSLVPDNPVQITDTVAYAQLAAGTLMIGLPVANKTGINQIEYIDTLMATLGSLVQAASKGGGNTNPDKLAGMFNILGNINEHVQMISADKSEQERVKKYQKQLMELGNALKALGQQLQQKMQAQGQQGQQGPDPEVQSKVQAQQQLTQAKIENQKATHAQKTGQREIQFQMEQQRKQKEFEANQARAQAEFDAEMQREHAITRQELQTGAVEAHHDMRLNEITTKSDIILEHMKERNKPKPKAPAKKS